jgi:hypothetical protein
MFAGRSGFNDRILRHHAAVVLNVDIQIFIRKHSLPELKNLCQAIRPQAMLPVAPDVSLQNNFVFFADAPAAVDEISGQMADLGHVGVTGDKVAIGQDKPGKSIWIGFENFAQLIEFHADSIYLYRNIVNGALTGYGSRA